MSHADHNADLRRLKKTPKTTDFRFVLEQTSVLASPDNMMAIVIAPWTSTGYHPMATSFRATLVFSLSADGWICMHSHMSLTVPQVSHANRPVKVWRTFGRQRLETRFESGTWRQRRAA